MDKKLIALVTFPCSGGCKEELINKYIKENKPNLDTPQCDEFMENVHKLSCTCTYPILEFYPSRSWVVVTKDIKQKSSEWCPEYDKTLCQILYNGTDFVIFNRKTRNFLEWTFESAGSGLMEVDYCPRFGEYWFVNPETKDMITIDDFRKVGIPVTDITSVKKFTSTGKFLEERNVCWNDTSNESDNDSKNV